jgi:hypothetical protein
LSFLCLSPSLLSLVFLFNLLSMLSSFPSSIAHFVPSSPSVFSPILLSHPIHMFIQISLFSLMQWKETVWIFPPILVMADRRCYGIWESARLAPPLCTNRHITWWRAMWRLWRSTWGKLLQPTTGIDTTGMIPTSTVLRRELHMPYDLLFGAPSTKSST